MPLESARTIPRGRRWMGKAPQQSGCTASSFIPIIPTRDSDELTRTTCTFKSAQREGVRRALSDVIVSFSGEAGCADEMFIAADRGSPRFSVLFSALFSALRSPHASNHGPRCRHRGGSANRDQTCRDRASPLGRQPFRDEQADSDAECRACADDESKRRQTEQDVLHGASDHTVFVNQALAYHPLNRCGDRLPRANVPSDR